MHKLGLVDVNGNLTPNGKNALKEMAGSRAYIKAEKERLESELLGHRRLPRTPHIEAEIQELEQQLAELNNLSQVAMDWMIMQANRPKAGTTLRDWLNRADTTPAQRIAEAERSARALQMVVEESRSIGKKVKGVFGWSESEKITKEESLAHGIYFFNQPVMEGQGRPIYLHFCEKNHVQAVHDPEKERDVINVVADVVSDPDQVDRNAPDAQGQVMARDMSALTDTLIGNDASPSFQRCFKDLTPGGDLSPF
ncbi:MAG: hypothetical protein HYZ47_00890 [Simkania negevensis]|nr:hypothetical protein [Simkania negevensis]